ncbi:IclR family transcriptional regulator [Alkalilacustris brevis]|uniref:IclR family transcriptional regulator n=1 Tax=Alkalilacustris brevis TaxID=2026338 RepID=UPI00138FFCE2|nr:IclR family transcriptional regulator [Alkalilacustris brevis]
MRQPAEQTRQAASRNAGLPEEEIAMETVAKAPAVRRIQSVDRALTIMEILAGRNAPMGLNDLAAAAGLNVSTCHHLVSTLVERGYVLHAGRSRGYMLSFKLADLAEAASHNFDIVNIVQTDLQELNENLRESVQMATINGTNLITQLRFGSHMPTHVEADEVKKMRAAHATATGKAILAWLPESEMLRIVSENGLTPFTDSTITSLSGLIEDLRLVRRTGYAVDEEELEKNVICYGAALRDGTGAVIGSVSVSIPKSRASKQYRAHIARSVVKCARTISDRLRVAHFK